MIRHRVLVADDTDDMRLLLTSLLEATGRFQIVGEASDGEEAVAEASRLQPDVVLLDLAMPRSDGLQAAPEVRRVSPHSAIIILSGFETDRVAQAALGAGADRYVEKGADIARIADVIDEALAARPQTSPSVAPAPPAERPAAPADPASLLAAYLSEIAHGIRTPLTVLSGAVLTLETRWHEMSDADRAQLIAMLKRATDRMNQLVGDLVHDGRFDVGRPSVTADSRG